MHLYILVKGGRLGLMPGVLFHSCRPSTVIPGLCSLSLRSLRGCVIYGTCSGIVTADVLELGLSRGAIAARKLEGVKRDKEHEGLYWFGPLR